MVPCIYAGVSRHPVCGPVPSVCPSLYSLPALRGGGTSAQGTGTPTLGDAVGPLCGYAERQRKKLKCMREKYFIHYFISFTFILITSSGKNEKKIFRETIATSMVSDALATQGARAYATMALTL